MKYTLQNYKFFKSYRFPIYDADKVQAEVTTYERENVKINSVKIESINLSGLNFICNQKYSIGENVSLKVVTNRLFNNWDFELKGTIIRSFIYCGDVTKTIYGLSISEESELNVLKYFLKDFLSNYKTKKLKDKLYKICQNKIEVNHDDAVELFALFQTLIDKTYHNDITSVLNELPKLFHCHNYHVLTYDEESENFLVDKTNTKLEINSSLNNALFRESFFNKILINKSFNEQKATGLDVEIDNMLMAPLISFNGDSVGLLCLTNSISGEKFNQSMVDKIKIISALISYYYNGNPSKLFETGDQEYPDHFIFSDRSTTGMSILQYLTTIKNTNENIYIRGEESTLKDHYAYYISGEIEAELMVDFKNPYKEFEFINHIEENQVTNIIIKNLHHLSLERQASLYNIISSLNVRIITLSEIDLKDLADRNMIIKDLYNLISVVKLYVPPLRLRKNEIVEIANHFLNYELKKRNLGQKYLSNSTIETLESGNWDINHLELNNLIIKAILKSDVGAQALDLAIEPLKKENVVKSNKNDALQKFILNQLENSDKSTCYTKKEKIFSEIFFSKKAS